jgi:hypothetical protein
MKIQSISSEELQEAMYDGGNGICLECGETTTGVEPDARGYRCSSCNNYSVYGIEEAMLMGMLDIIED